MAFILKNARSKTPFVAVPYSMGLIDRATAAEQLLGTDSHCLFLAFF